MVVNSIPMIGGRTIHATTSTVASAAVLVDRGAALLPHAAAMHYVVVYIPHAACLLP